MRIYKQVVRNIGPFGNKDITIDFSGKPMLSLLMGKNGEGKSTLIKTFKMGLYQETDGIPVKEVANDINRNGYVATYFRSNGHDWVIEVMYSPNKLRLYQGTEISEKTLLDKGKTPETKQYIRDEVLDIPYYVFNNILSLNMHDFKSFLTMKVADTRNIRDRIFGFYVLNEMVKLHKEKTNEQLQRYESLKNSIKASEEGYENAKAEYDKLQAQMRVENESKLQMLRDEQGVIDQEIMNLNGSMEGLKASMDMCDKQVQLIKRLEAITNIEGLKSHMLLLWEEIEGAESKYRDNKAKLDELEGSRKLMKYYELTGSISQKETKLKDLKASMFSLKEEHEQKIKMHGECKEELAAYEELKMNHNKLEVGLNASTSLLSDMKQFQEMVKLDEQVLMKESETKDNLKKVNEAIIKIGPQVAKLEEDIQVFGLGECPTCGSDLTRGEHEGKLGEYKDKLSERLNKKKELEGIRSKVEQVLSSMTKDVQDRKNNIHSIWHRIINNPLFEGDRNSMSLTMDTSILVKLRDDSQATLEGFKLPTEEQITEVTEKINTSRNEANDIKMRGESMSGEYKAISASMKSQVQEMEALSGEIDTSKAIEGMDEHQLNEQIGTINSLLSSYQQKINEARSEMTTDEIKVTQHESTVNMTQDLSEMKREYETEQEARSKKDELGMKKRDLSNNMEHKKLRSNELKYQIQAMMDGTAYKAQLESITNIMDKFTEKMKEHKMEMDEISREAEYNNLLLDILSDTGVKSYILKEVTPFINSEIAENLQALSVPQEVMFDDEFKPHIYRRGRETSLATVSTGQKKKIDFCITISIIMVLIYRYGGLNTVFFDEIFGSVDEESRVIVLDKIKRILVEKMGLNVILVNHFYFPSSFFDQYMLVRQDDGWSTVDFKSPDETISLAGLSQIPTELEKADI